MAWPLATRAQQAGKVIRLGFLGGSLNSPLSVALYQAFLGQLRKLGFSEGQNLIVEYRAVDDPRGPFIAAAEMMRSHPDLIHLLKSLASSLRLRTPIHAPRLRQAIPAGESSRNKS